MSTLKKISILLLICVPISSANAQVLRVISGYEITANISEIPTQMALIQQAINDTSGVSEVISYANLGFPVLLTGSISGTTNQQNLQSAINNTNISSLRNSEYADIAIVFVDQLPSGDCGWAGDGINFYWDNAAGISPPDTRMSETYYVAIVSTTSDCRQRPYWAAHEFAHLFGAAHERDAGQGPGLYGDSYADFKKPVGAVNGKYTIMKTWPDLYCGSSGCDEEGEYSNISTQTNSPGNYNERNDRAINATKASVALYREPPPPCSLTPPLFLSGYINNICYGGNLSTEHIVSWVDACPSASAQYDMYFKGAGTSQPYQYFGTRAVTWDDIYVSGADAYIKVNACDSFGTCTTLSVSRYYAEFVECH